MSNLKASLRSLFFKLPEPIVRLVISYRYDKEVFASYLKSKAENPSENAFLDIYRINMWHTEESVSGGGSTIDATKTVRKVLPEVIEKYNIKSMLDVPCGDYNWMKLVDKKCKYIGADIVEDIIKSDQEKYTSEDVSFQVLDMTKDQLPKVDLIFCKDCLQHLSYENVAASLNNFKNSGAKYLLVSTFPKTWRNHDIYDGDYRPLNIRKSPFNLPKPIFKFREESIAEGVEPDKDMYLYEMSQLPTIKL